MSNCFNEAQINFFNRNWPLVLDKEVVHATECASCYSKLNEDARRRVDLRKKPIEPPGRNDNLSQVHSQISTREWREQQQKRR